MKGLRGGKLIESSRYDSGIHMCNPMMLRPTINIIPRRDTIVWLEAKCSEPRCTFIGAFPTVHPENPFPRHYCPEHNRSIKK